MLINEKISKSISTLALLLIALSSVLLFQNCSAPGTANGDVNSNGLPLGPAPGDSVIGTTGNIAPTVGITAPSSGASFTEPATFEVTADAADENGNVIKVEFYLDNALAGQDTTAPFRFELTGVLLGTHTIYTMAYDNDGGITTSSAIQVGVTAIPIINPCTDNYSPPTLSLPAALQTVNLPIGMRPLSPADIENAYDRRPYNLTAGRVPLAQVDIECDIVGNDDNITVNCNENGIRIEPNDDIECTSGGPVQVNITVDDLCPAGQLAQASMTINYTNVCSPEFQVQASDPQIQATFGSRVAIDGDYAVVSAPGRGGNSKIGAAYVFKRSGTSWLQQAILAPSNATFTEINAVAIKGDVIAIASRASAENGHEGRVYVYEGANTTWTLRDTITGPTSGSLANPNDVTHFGLTLDIGTNDSIVIGADGEDLLINGTAAQDGGSVYVYNRSLNSWNFAQKLTASNTSAYYNFGRSVSTSGNLLVVGAPIKASEEAAFGRGRAYVFVKSGGNWVESSILQAAAAQGTRMQYGEDVDTDGTRIVVSAKESNNGRGRAYVYSGANWDEMSVVVPDLQSLDYFGRGVAISGDSLFVSAPGARAADGVKSGATFVFNRNGNNWVLDNKLIPQQATRDDEQNAGSDIAVSNGVLLIGSESRDSANQNNSGAAYFINY